MNFKKVELNGFKSFADKTEIKFGDGVTCIVGPNGCGKSNVADAIRWVLGEQSDKTMRGSSMQDVIFGGTQQRKSQSFCEVTLTFDNSTHMFSDLEYNEVAMTRRLYRSGESEYLINRQPCRMKDIVDRLHEVGLGKEGYSIIGQGKIEQIMNAKPEDRRAIFEEATGIVVFKARRQEIERRLSNSYTNLNIFLQRMSEVEHMLTPLARQAEKTKKYRELYASLKHAEINLYIYKHDNAASARERIAGAVAAIQAQIDACRAESERLEAQYADDRRRLAESDELLQKLNEQILRITVELQKKEGDAQVIRERIAFCNRQREADEKTAESGAARLQEIAAESEKALRSAQAQEKKIEKCRREIETLSAEVAELGGKLSESEALTDASQRSVIDTIEDLSEIRQNIGTLSARKEAAEERLQELAAQAQKTAAELEADKKSLAACADWLAEVEEYVAREPQERAARKASSLPFPPRRTNRANSCSAATPASPPCASASASTATSRRTSRAISSRSRSCWARRAGTHPCPRASRASSRTSSTATRSTRSPSRRRSAARCRTSSPPPRRTPAASSSTSSARRAGRSPSSPSTL